MPPHVRAIYRRLRTVGFSLIGRNPLGYTGTYAEELRVARTIRDVDANPPVKLRTEGTLALWRTPVGEIWAPLRADAFFMRMLTIEHLMNVYCYTPRGGDVVMDCGANIGMFSKPAADAGATVIAFEPSSENVQAFSRNLERHLRSGRVILREEGVWSEPRTLYLQVSPNGNPGSHRVTSERGSDTQSITLTTIDSVAEALGLTRLDFLKMDIEGSEVPALQGGRNTIARFRPRMGLGTEHTDDILANNLAVVKTVGAIDAQYRAQVTEVHPNGGQLVPYSLVFEPVR